MIGASNIASFTEDSKAARLCNQRYDFIRDRVCRSHNWNCLLTRVTLTPDATAPAFEFANAFTLPTDPFCLRPVNLDTSTIVFNLEGRKILTDEGTINLIYIARELDINKYDAGLIETISMALAADFAYPLTNSVSLGQAMLTKYNQTVSEARFMDAVEGASANNSTTSDRMTLEANEFINARI
tara:strand:+ start:130 stop:681 length:552 start_codon:yes stop_codon:yes gene_type:complete